LKEIFGVWEGKDKQVLGHDVVRHNLRFHHLGIATSDHHRLFSFTVTTFHRRDDAERNELLKHSALRVLHPFGYLPQRSELYIVHSNSFPDLFKLLLLDPLLQVLTEEARVRLNKKRRASHERC
jgi:hypothetical protein